jgi:hypothetical protein
MGNAALAGQGTLIRQNPLSNRNGHERAAKLYQMAEAASPDRQPA